MPAGGHPRPGHQLGTDGAAAVQKWEEGESGQTALQAPSSGLDAGGPQEK